MGSDAFSIDLATFPADEADVGALLHEYRDAAPNPICFRSFDDEIRELGQRYAHPSGGLLLARHRATVAGCVGWWRIDDVECEMRRVFVRPMFRGQQLGRRLVSEFIARARSLGFQSTTWHSLPAMHSALHLYHSMGFREERAQAADEQQPVHFRVWLQAMGEVPHQAFDANRKHIS